MNHNVTRLLAGACAGLVATAPMTALMTICHRLLPAAQRGPLPPRKLTLEAAEQVNLDDDLSEPEKRGLTMAAHYGYGAAMGALYALAEPALAPLPLASRGIAFGLGVWTVSYLGWLPAVGSSAAASEETPRRNGLMIAAHVVWGAAAGSLFQVFIHRAASSYRSRPRRVKTSAKAASSACAWASNRA